MSDRFQHHQGSTGTGGSRSGSSDPAQVTADPDTSDAIRVGATTSSHPSEVGGGANQSGSGGSGGSSDPDEEGSSGQSMDELLVHTDQPSEVER